jgi:hypothetical protein
MSYTLHPNEFFRTSLKIGMSGWDVATLQIALDDADAADLAVDGEFGAATQTAVKVVQSKLNATPDGIAGPETMSKVCVAASRSAQAGLCPHDLLKGLVLGESSGIIPETTPIYSNGSRDYGAWQRNELNPTQERLRACYGPLTQARIAAKLLADAQHRFVTEPYCRESSRGAAECSWRLAVLFWNWETAAEAIAEGRGSTWRYQDSDGRLIGLADPAKWVEAIGAHHAGKLIETGWEWATFYIDAKVVYVSSWVVT